MLQPSGLDLVPELNEQLSFDFFAAQSDLMREMELRGTTLVPTTDLTRQRISLVSGGITEIGTADYSGFLIVGLGFNIVKIMDALRTFHLFEFHDNDNEVATYISRACFSALVASILRNTSAIHFARLLRSASKARIVVIPQPYPSEDILTGGQSGVWKQAVSSGLLNYVAQTYEDAAKRVISNVECEYLPQPADTLLAGPFTQARFSRDSTRLSKDMDTKHAPSEPYHMNAIYGLEVLKCY